MEKLSFCSLIIIVILLSFCKGNVRQTDFRLINEDDPILEIGSDAENQNETEIIYKNIMEYYVDVNMNIYIGDIYGRKIDKFDENGALVCCFGRHGQGPGEFDYLPFFAADSHGTLYAAYKKIWVFASDGIFKKYIYFPDNLENYHAAGIKIDGKDNIYILMYTEPYKHKLMRTDKYFNEFVTIHEEINRIDTEFIVPSVFGGFTPSFDFDDEGNIYITSTTDYEIFIYSKDGSLIKTIKKEFKKYRFTEKDLNLPTFKDKEMMTLPQSFLSRLYDNHKFFPAIFGINIDGGKCYVWSSARDADYKFIIDIFDMKFRRLGRSAYYNYIKKSCVVIKNNKLYTLDIRSDDKEYKELSSRIAFFNEPYKLLVYEIISDTN